MSPDAADRSAQLEPPMPRPDSHNRVRGFVAIAYCAAEAAFYVIAATSNTSIDFPGDTYVALRFMVGFTLGRWWAVALPLVAVPLALVLAVFGHPPPDELRAALVLAFSCLLLASGVGLRRLVGRKPTRD